MRGGSVLSTEEKADLVRRLEAGERASALANEAGVLRKSLYPWRAAYLAFGAAGLNRRKSAKCDRRGLAKRGSFSLWPFWRSAR